MKENGTYPDSFIRGIYNEKNIEDEAPSMELFSQFATNPNRPGFDYKELSITWYDCEEAMNKIFQSKNSDDSFQFGYGAAVLSTHELDKLCKKRQVRNYLKYERYPVTENEYHGNLLLSNTAEKKHKYMAISGLVLDCFQYIKQRNED